MPFLTNDPLSLAFSDFLLGRQARNQTHSTLRWYRRYVKMLGDFLRAQGVERIEDVTATHVRRFLIQLSENLTPGGVVTVYTGVRAFLRWYADEYAPTGWNPLAKVKAPKRPKDILSPLSLSL